MWKDDYVSLTAKEPYGRPTGRTLTNADCHLVLLNAAQRELEAFERRYRNCSDLQGAVDLVRTARKIATELAVRARRAGLKPV